MRKTLSLFILSFLAAQIVVPVGITIHDASENTFTASKKLSRVANRLYSTLNFSPLFLVENLLDSKKMRQTLLNPYLGRGEQITVKTDLGEKINCTYFDRRSDTLIIIGAGFGNEREKVAPLVHIFDRCDVVLFDYRGHGQDKPTLLDLSQWGIKPNEPLKELIDSLMPSIDENRVPRIDLKQTTLGEHEDKDLIAVANHFKKKNIYKSTFGVAFCFSSYVFAKAAALNPGLFDKLILDSSLESPEMILHRIKKNPQLIFDPQRGSWNVMVKKSARESDPTILELLSKNSFVETVASFLRDNLPEMATNDSTANYLAQLDIPILFIHGKQDQMTPYENDFVKNWDATKSKQKAAIVFDDTKHLLSFLKYKELYKCVGTLFFEVPYETFIENLKKPENILQYKVNQIMRDFKLIDTVRTNNQ